MEQSVNRPTKQRGRGFGKPNLSDETKIGIIGAKQLQLMSQSKIAQEFGVARFTVNRLSEDDLSPDGKSKLLDYTAKLTKARDKIIDRINEKLDNNDFKDGVYPQLYTAINTGHRLATDQSTTNISVKSEAINLMLSNGTVKSLADAEALYEMVKPQDDVDGELD